MSFVTVDTVFEVRYSERIFTWERYTRSVDMLHWVMDLSTLLAFGWKVP